MTADTTAKPSLEVELCLDVLTGALDEHERLIAASLLPVPNVDPLTRLYDASFDDRLDAVLAVLPNVVRRCRRGDHKDKPERMLEMIGQAVPGLVDAIYDEMEDEYAIVGPSDWPAS